MARPCRDQRRTWRRATCRLDAWLVTDGRAELIRELRELAAAHGLVPRACDFSSGGLRLVAQPVVHTSHPTFGYVIEAAGRRVVWAPEFFGEFGADGASYTLRGGRQ